MKFLRLAIVFLFFAAIFIVPARGQNEKPIRVETDLVSINVSVTDKQGNPVKGLRQEQFEIFADGVRQQIAHFSDAESAVSFGIVFDLRPLSNERTSAILEALQRFTKEIPAKDDFFVLTFDGRGSFVFDFVPTEKQIQTELSDKSGEPNSLYDAICLGTDKIKEKKTSKRTLLVISDGADGNSRHDFEEMRRHLREFDAQIYAVVFDRTESEPTILLDVVRQRKLRLNISKDATPLDRAAVEEMTKASGGIYHASAMNNSLEIYEMLRHSADDRRRQYAIGFYPANADGKWHKIKINVVSAGDKNKRLFASYRRGYQSPPNRSDK